MPRQTGQVVDEILIIRCQAGDAGALEIIARRWHRRLLRLAMRLLLDAEAATEAVQEAWVAIVRGIAALEDPSRFAPWAYRIVRHKCADRIRRAARERARSAEFDDALESDAAADASVVSGEREATIRLLRRAIRSLPAEQRTLLSLFYFDGLAVGEIAEAMDIPSGTVKSRLFHLRARLRRMMEER